MKKDLDKQNTRINMSLEDFELLDRYKRWWKELTTAIRNKVYIDQTTSEKIYVKIKKNELQDLLVPYAASDCELDMYPDESIEVEWI
jgi:hypothetical protein